MVQATRLLSQNESDTALTKSTGVKYTSSVNLKIHLKDTLLANAQLSEVSSLY